MGVIKEEIFLILASTVLKFSLVLLFDPLVLPGKRCTELFSEKVKWLGSEINVAYFLGLLTGDGSISVGCQLCCGAKQSCDKIRLWINSNLPCLNVVQNSHKKGNWYLQISCNKLLNKEGHGNRKTTFHYMLENFGLNKTCYNKRVPSDIFTSNVNVISAYLAGLIDSDGCISITSSDITVCHYTSVNKELLKDICHLLRILGISHQIRDLRIHVWDTELLKKYIEGYLVVRSFNYRTTCGTRSSWIPKWAFRNFIETSGVSGRKFCKSNNIARGCLSNKRKYVTSYTAIKAGMYLGDVRYYRVCDIQKVKEQQFYGISVVDNHNLIANGIVAENCYQETVMQVFMALAGLTESDGYSFMKGCAKKKKHIIDRYKEVFVKGTKINKVSEEVSNKIWEDLEKFSGYAFNKTLYFLEGIITSKGEYTIEELFYMDRSDFPQVYSSNGELVDIIDVHDHGIVPMYRVTLSNGSSHTCTMHHKFASTLGTLPLYKIIEQDAQLIVNRRVKNASSKTMAMSCMSSGSTNTDTAMEPQKTMLCVGKKEIEKLLESKQDKFSQILGQHHAKKNGCLSKEDVEICFKSDFTESTGARTKVEVNAFSECPILFKIPEKSYKDSYTHFVSTRCHLGSDEPTEKMERRKSKTILRAMCKTIYNTEDLAIRSQKSIGKDFDSHGSKVFSGCKKQGIYNEISASSGRFLEPDEKDTGRIRWSTSFQERIRETAKNVYRKRPKVQQSYVKQGLYGNSNFLRCMDSSTKTVQIYGNGNTNRCSYKRSNQTARDFYRSHVQVIDIEYIGQCQGYDLEIDSADHLYCLSSGVVTSNSHATSYAHLGMQTAYLKAHYPTEFMAALLSVNTLKRDFDKVAQYEKDCVKNLSIRIFEPDLNKSKLNWIIEGDSDIRKPLLLKGIGIKAAEEIVNNQPYSSKDTLFDFVSKISNKSSKDGESDEKKTMAVNTKVIECMWDAGLWKGHVKSKAELKQKFEAMKSDIKKNKGKPMGDIC